MRHIQTYPHKLCEKQFKQSKAKYFSISAYSDYNPKQLE